MEPVGGSEGAVEIRTDTGAGGRMLGTPGGKEQGAVRNDTMGALVPVVDVFA